MRHTYLRTEVTDRILDHALGRETAQYIVSAEADDQYRLATFSTITAALLYANPLADLGYRVIITAV